MEILKYSYWRRFSSLVLARKHCQAMSCETLLKFCPGVVALVDNKWQLFGYHI